MRGLFQTVDVLQSDNSQYEVLHYFGRKMHEALLRLGFKSRLLTRSRWLEVLSEDPPDFTIGFNGAPKEAETGMFLCDYLKIPHVSCLVDPPFRFADVIRSPYVLTTCDDLFCCESFLSSKTPHVYFFPHSVEPELANETLDGERIYPTVMFGTFIEFEKRRKWWERKYSRELCKVLDAAIEATFADEETNFIRAFFDAFKEMKVDPKEIDLAHVLSELEFYIKGRDRIDLLRSIKNVEVHVFGGTTETFGWEAYLGNQRNIIIHGPVSFVEAISLMKQSKIVLNSGLKNKNGAHERVFTGMACGAVVVTNENLYTCKHFEEDKNILLYRHSDLDSLNEKLVHCLENDALRREIAQSGREEILKYHTWDERLKQLLREIDPVLREFGIQH